MRSSTEKAAMKIDFARYASKHNLIVVITDTSPRGLDFDQINENKDPSLGYSAGHYCNATTLPYSTHFNMFTYITEELPNLISANFQVSAQSIMGHSMGGGGALVSALLSKGKYRSVSAIAPIC